MDFARYPFDQKFETPKAEKVRRRLVLLVSTVGDKLRQCFGKKATSSFVAIVHYDNTRVRNLELKTEVT